MAHRTILLGLAAAALSAVGVAKANPVDLSAYVDANGFLNVQALTCGQLANTYQEDANALMSWSGTTASRTSTTLTTRKAARPNTSSSDIASNIKTRRSFTQSASSSRKSAPRG